MDGQFNSGWPCGGHAHCFKQRRVGRSETGRRGGPETGGRRCNHPLRGHHGNELATGILKAGFLARIFAIKHIKARQLDLYEINERLDRPFR
jgi:hypothetical protein